MPDPDRSGIYTIAANGTDMTRLFAFSGCLSWSPAGMVVVYTDSFLQQTVAIVNADGTVRNSFAVPFPSVESVSWSPDGSRLVYGSVFGGIYVTTANGSDPVEISTGSYPVWGPGGSGT